MVQNSLLFLLLDAHGKDLCLLEAISLLPYIKERWKRKGLVSEASYSHMASRKMWGNEHQRFQEQEYDIAEMGGPISLVS